MGAPASTGCANSFGAGLSGEARTPPSPISPCIITGGGTGPVPPASATSGCNEPPSESDADGVSLPASAVVTTGGFGGFGFLP